MRKDVKKIGFLSPKHAAIVESVSKLEQYFAELQQYLTEGSLEAAKTTADCVALRSDILARQISEVITQKLQK